MDNSDGKWYDDHLTPPGFIAIIGFITLCASFLMEQAATGSPNPHTTTAIASFVTLGGVHIVHRTAARQGAKHATRRNGDRHGNQQPS